MTFPLDPTIIAAIVTAVGAPVYMDLKKRRQQKNKAHNAIEHEVAFITEVDTTLERLLVQLQADRIFISQFHNGGNFYPSGSSMKKISMCYEVLSGSTPSTKFNHQNIPVSLFPRIMAALVKEEKICVGDVEDENILGVKGVLEARNCQSVYYFSLRDISKRLFGVLVVDFNRKTFLSSAQLDNLCREAAMLGGLFSKHLKIK